ncbi:MAG: tetratricopeptide repeat protein [Hyphomicrobiaceae bacterium]
MIQCLPVGAQSADDWKVCKNADLSVEPEVAIKACDKIQNIDGLKKQDRVLAIFYFARGFEDKKDYDRALIEYSQVVELDPGLAEAYIGRGTAYVEKGEFDRGIREYTRSLEIRKRVSAFYGRGRAYKKKGETAKAVADYRAALALDPNHETAKNSKAALKELGATH